MEELLKLFPKTDFKWTAELDKITTKIKKPWNFVGGCVRDSLLGIQTDDIDINTTALPEEIEVFMAGMNVSVVGKRFGTIGVFYKHWKIEITTTREDIRTYGRRADVEFVSSFEVDSSRRDFTINALMFNGREITDYHNGIADLQAGKVVFIHDADRRIKEDFLRIMRYVRFLCRFSSKLAYDQYERVIQDNLKGLRQLSIERIVSEIYGMCKYPRTSEAIKILNKLGISSIVFGEKLNECIQDSWPKEKKLAFIFILLKKEVWQKLPIVRSAKIFLEVALWPYEDITLNFAYFWNRFHDANKASIFLDVFNTLNKTNYEITAEDFSVNYAILDQYENKTKGQILTIMRYLHLVHLPLTTDQVNLCLEKLKYNQKPFTKIIHNILSSCEKTDL